MATAKLGLIVGNRDLFPDHLIAGGRADMLEVLRGQDIEPVVLGEDEGGNGAVETYAHAKECAKLFRQSDIDGVVVTLPNFGDERGVADALKLAALDVPVLVHGYPDDVGKLDISNRRDAFCGKISVCSNLRQVNIPFSLTTKHVVAPRDESFLADLKRFAGVCRVVKGMRTARLGAVGARPNAFNTVRFSEKLLESSGISVSTIDLSEVLAGTNALADDDARVREKVDEIQAYANTDAVPAEPITRMAKFAVVLGDWIEENELDGTAIQCWISMQENFGINACTVMSMLSEKLLPSACEVDVTGLLAMYALQLASGGPSALVDWNNNYGDEDDKCALFHCGNWARSFLAEAKMGTAPILGAAVDEGRTCGALDSTTLPGPVTYARITTDDEWGVIRTYVGEGRVTDDPIETFGCRAVIEVPGLQGLMQYVCALGFEHHVAINRSQVADILDEAFTKYLGWETYHHQQ
ncbi:MAG: L-fucose/L-arabinose isomerase family protein [Armatimonadota bacterium]|jgi:L-fucose isomerase-like protein